MKAAALATAHSSPARAQRWLSVFGLMIACLLGYAAVATVQDYRHMAASGKIVEGRMTGSYRQEQTRRNGTLISVKNYPTFSYRTEKGEFFQGTVSDPVQESTIEPGRTMSLRYDPDKPTYIRLAAAVDDGPGFMPWVLGAAALLFGALSTRGLFRRRSPERSARLRPTDQRTRPRNSL
jgi:Protein of unknown function (DUF3592)